ncbi:MAG: CHASE2 domain-containing protein [Geminicoccaceae bacterium]|nr:CHASE2 domain-containing protein [Geminicoccaceae bacterium]MCB9942198.1 CHASE2 domain-containing protein [Geminicoccaceae bacterium]
MTGLLGFFGLATRLDNRIYDLALHSWTPPAPSDVVVVTIDESSLFELGRFPWSRRLHARLIDRLNEAGAAGVAFDIIFAEPDWENLSGDEEFARAIRSYGPVVMPVFTDVRVGGQLPEEIRPLPRLIKAGVGLGHVELEVDPDGVVRKIRPTTGLPPNQRPYLVAALLERAVKSGGYRADLDPLRPDSLLLDESWTLIPFSARNRFDRMTFADVVQGRISPERLRGKLVLVGATASGLGSTFSTPLSSNGVPMPGVVLHAHLLNALSHGIVWHELRWPLLIAVLVAFAVASSILVQHSRRPFYATLAVILLMLVISAAMLQLLGVWIPPGAAMIGALASWAGWSVVVRQMERAAVRTERERAAVTLRAIADAVVTVGPDGHINYLNPAAQMLTGWSGQSAHGRLLAEVVRCLLGETNQPVSLGDNELNGKRVRARLRRRDGTIREILVSRGQIFDEHGSPSGHVIVLHDITEQEASRRLFEESERRRRELERELQHAGRLSAVGQVSASIAHEVNQPLTAMTTYASVARRLAEREDPGSRAKLIEAIHKVTQQAERAGLVIRRLRRFFEKGREEMGLHDLGEVVDESIELAMIGKYDLGISVEVDLDKRVPQVPFDRIQIQQVIVNLVRNAAEAVAGCDRRELRVASRLRGGDVEVSVADTGAGIPPEVQAALFEPFHSSKPGGMGLGLSISRTIVEAHGGELRARAAEGGGTVFSFNLPLQVHADA